MWFVTDSGTVVCMGEEAECRAQFIQRRRNYRPQYRGLVRLYEGIERSDSPTTTAAGVDGFPIDVVPTSAPSNIPKVGDGATMQVGSDAYPFTVVGATRLTVRIQRDSFRIISGSFQTGDAVVEYTPNPAGLIITARWSTRKGRKPGYFASGSRVTVGVRRYYQDPSF